MLSTLWEQFGEFDWPAQSPELNPNKHILAELERRPLHSHSHPTPGPELTSDTLLNLVEYLSRDVKSVIAAKNRP